MTGWIQEATISYSLHHNIWINRRAKDTLGFRDCSISTSMYGRRNGNSRIHSLHCLYHNLWVNWRRKDMLEFPDCSLYLIVFIPQFMDQPMEKWLTDRSAPTSVFGRRDGYRRIHILLHLLHNVWIDWRRKDRRMRHDFWWQVKLEHVISSPERADTY